MTFGNLAFCLSLYFTGVHSRGELQHVSDVSEQKMNDKYILFERFDKFLNGNLAYYFFR